MTCQEHQPLITGYLDGELSPEQRRQIEDHLAVCERCRQELADLAALKEKLAMIQFKEPSDAELARYWSRVYNRLERGVGWILFSLGAIVVLCYGAFRMLEDLIRDPAVSLALKAGVVVLVAGAIILFVSLARERLAVRKVDRYSKEVKR